MKDQRFIVELIDWIEKNIEQPLHVDRVAERAGYSKWHLMRIFKAETRYALAEYIRLRKLSHAAIDIWLTRRRIGDIADKYNFGSQQTFCRLFKRHFKVSPVTYRKSVIWTPYGILSPLNIEIDEQFHVWSEHYSGSRLYGNIHQYVLNTENMNAGINMSIHRAINSHMYSRGEKPREIYGIYDFGESLSNNIHGDISYTVLIPDDKNNVGNHLLLKGGTYIRFNKKGVMTELKGVFPDVFHTLFPKRDVHCRGRLFIEHLNFDTATGLVDCNYYIPSV